MNAMDLTLKEVLEFPLFETSKRLTQGVPRAGVSSVNIMLDKEILNWIEQDGQILLMTGEILEPMPLDRQIALFKAVAAKGVVAIFIKISPYLDALHEDLVSACNELKVQLLDLDYRVSFTDIFAQIYDGKFKKQNAILRRVETLHKDTMQVMTNGGGIEDILRSVHKTIDAPIFVRDYYFENTYYLKDVFQEDYEHLFENIESTHLEGKQPKIIWDRIAYKGKEIPRLMVPVLVKNKPFGHVVMYGRENEISNYDKLGLEATSNIIALEFLKTISVQEVDNQYRVEFFDDLISGDPMRRAKAIEKAQSFRLSEHSNYVGMELRLTGKSNADRNLKLTYLIELICKDMGRPYMIVNRAEHIYLLLPMKEGETIETARQYGQRILTFLAGKIKRQAIHVGIGRIHKGLCLLYKSITEAEKALDAALHYMGAPLMAFDDLGIYKIFSQEAVREELSLFYADMLGALQRYDARKETELVKTLEAYFACNGNLKKMSQMLFTHYNTVLYRLGRIQAIADIHLEDEEQRYAVQTALKIGKVLRENATHAMEYSE